MSQIQIICSKPGIRRNGIEHPASAVYPADHWSEKELQAFKDDPAFIVQDVASGGVKLSGAAFDTAVAAEVEKQVLAITQTLQTSFNAKVEEAAKERLADAKADHDNAMDALGKKLKAAEEKIALLETPAAPAPSSESADGDAGEAKPKASAKK